MTVLTATVAAASVVVPLVLQGERLGVLHEAGCSAEVVESTLASLDAAGRAPTHVDPIVIDTGNLLAPDPNTRYAVDRGGPGLTALARALTAADGQPLFDLMIPGRFDFALRRDRLSMLTGQARLPWTIANLKPGFQAQPYRIVERSGLRIGLTAVIDERLHASLHPWVRGEGLTAARAAVEASVRALRKAGADLVVAGFHQASDADLQAILRLVEGAEARPDVLVLSPVAGGIAQIGLGRGEPIVVAAPSGLRQALVAHVEVRRGSGERPRFLGARLAELSPAPDPALTEVRREVCEALGRPIGPKPSEDRPITRAEFVQFVLELMRRRTGAEVAVINRRAVSDVFPLRAPLTSLDLMRTLPFEDGIQVTDVLGAQMGGLMRLTTDGRVHQTGLSASRRVAGRAIDNGRTYRVAVVDFLAEGGDEVFAPDAFAWRPQDLGQLRTVVTEYLSDHGFDADADPDPDSEPSEPALLSAQLNLGGNLKTVTVANSGNYEAPQLSRNPFLGISALVDLRVIADFTRHRFQLFERTRYGIAREGTADAEENDDVTTVELTYIGRFASKDTAWYIPNASAAVSLETELTVPGEDELERNYRRALLQAGIGPSLPLLPNVSFRVQLGLRRELLASPTSEDEQERLLAQTRMALLSTFEVLKYTFPTNYGRPLSTTLRVDYAFDLTGTVRDNILQGRLDFDIPVARRLSVTMGLELYFQDRNLSDGVDPRSSLAFDTSFGIKTFGDLSTVLF